METGSANDRAAVFPAELRPALAMLVRAFGYAADCHLDGWQFAVETTELLAKGATIVDLRWLILRGFAQHAREITIPGESERSFRPLPVTCFPADTCLVLSADGAKTLRTALSGDQTPASYPSCNMPSTNGLTSPRARTPPRPEWDEGRRELRYKGSVVKRYRVPAPNQEAILASFQTLEWPDVIASPLPNDAEHEPKQQLRVTIRSLNRNHLQPLLKFHGNGNGRQIHWTAIESCLSDRTNCTMSAADLRSHPNLFRIAPRSRLAIWAG